MNNNKLLALLNKLQIAFGIGFLVMILIYFYYYPVQMNGTIDKSLFTLVFTNASGTIESFNTLLLLALLLLLVQIVVTVYTFKVNDKISAILKDNVFMNLVFSTLLVLSLVVFYALVPTQVNGEIIKGFFQVRFEVLNSEFTHAWFFAYPVTVIYIGYNIYSAILYSKEVEVE